MWWVIERRNDALLGCLEGVAYKKTIDGPFINKAKALKAKDAYKSKNYIFYELTKSNFKPIYFEEEFSYLDLKYFIDF